jgi:hypothetical protein
LRRFAADLSDFSKNCSGAVSFPALPDIESGTGVKIYIESNQVRLARDNADVVRVTRNDTGVGICEIGYGQDVHRRIGTAVAVGVFTLGVGALIALSKSKKHVDCHPEAAESRAQASDSQRRACKAYIASSTACSS